MYSSFVRGSTASLLLRKKERVLACTCSGCGPVIGALQDRVSPVEKEHSSLAADSSKQTLLRRASNTQTSTVFNDVRNLHAFQLLLPCMVVDRAVPQPGIEVSSSHIPFVDFLNNKNKIAFRMRVITPLATPAVNFRKR